MSCQMSFEARVSSPRQEQLTHRHLQDPSGAELLEQNLPVQPDRHLVTGCAPRLPLLQVHWAVHARHRGIMLTPEGPLNPCKLLETHFLRLCSLCRECEGASYWPSQEKLFLFLLRSGRSLPV